MVEKFKSEYLYNIRHAYGDVGGDAIKRGRGYTPYSCQKLLTEALPSSGQNHGCPYRTYSPDNLTGLLQSLGVTDRDLLKGVREDVGKQRYHIACNRVFEAAHKGEIKKVSFLLACHGQGSGLMYSIGQGAVLMASERARHYSSSEYVFQAEFLAQEYR